MKERPAATCLNIRRFTNKKPENLYGFPGFSLAGNFNLLYGFSCLLLLLLFCIGYAPHNVSLFTGR